MATDIHQTLQDLYQEKERIERVIASLEALLHHGAAGQSARKTTRRGRKSMGAEERREVSRRMIRYWADRRQREKLANG